MNTEEHNEMGLIPDDSEEFYNQKFKACMDCYLFLTQNRVETRQSRENTLHVLEQRKQMYQSLNRQPNSVYNCSSTRNIEKVDTQQ